MKENEIRFLKVEPHDNEFYRIKKFPICLNILDISTANEEVLNKVIAKKYHKPYDNINVNEIM